MHRGVMGVSSAQEAAGAVGLQVLSMRFAPMPRSACASASNSAGTGAPTKAYAVILRVSESAFQPQAAGILLHLAIILLFFIL